MALQNTGVHGEKRDLDGIPVVHRGPNPTSVTDVCGAPIPDPLSRHGTRQGIFSSMRDACCRCECNASEIEVEALDSRNMCLKLPHDAFSKGAPLARPEEDAGTIVIASYPGLSGLHLDAQLKVDRVRLKSLRCHILKGFSLQCQNRGVDRVAHLRWLPLRNTNRGRETLLVAVGHVHGA